MAGAAAAAVRTVGPCDVRYAAGDGVGRAAALVGALAPVWAAAHLGGLAWARRDPRTVLLGAGLCVSHAGSYVLKALLRQERPRENCEALGTCGEFGLPSTHASFMAYVAAAAALELFAAAADADDDDDGPRRKRRAPGHGPRRRKPPPAARWVVSGGLAALAAAVAWSRVYLGYHSAEQVLAGAAAGAAFAVGWRRVQWRFAPLAVRGLELLGRVA